MKKAKVIKRKEKNRKWYWLFALLLLLLLFTAMPMANIPGFGRMAALLGLPHDAMRTLTLSDLAFYAAGVKGNKISSYRDYYASSVYDSRGGAGLSPFSITSKNRLLDAREAYLREYEQTGKRFGGVQGSISLAQTPGSNVAYEGVMFRGGAMAPGSKVGPNGEPLVAPIIDAQRVEVTEYGREYGNPIFGNLVTGSMVSTGNNTFGGRMTLPVKGKNTPEIVGSAGGDSSFQRSVEDSASKFRGGRLGAFGGFSAIVNRVGASNNAHGQLGALSSMRNLGRAYFYSFNAKGAGYKATAKQLAEAAFDGGEVEAETLIVPGEKEDVVVNDLRPPNSTLNKIKGRQNACNAARKAYQQAVPQQREALKQMYDALKAIGKASPSKTGIPGTCSSNWPRNSKMTKKLRKEWNSMVDKITVQCQDFRNDANNYASACGMSYQSSFTQKCDSYSKMKLKGYKPISNYLKAIFQWKSCKNNSRDMNDKKITLGKLDNIYDEINDDDDAEVNKTDMDEDGEEIKPEEEGKK